MQITIYSTCQGDGLVHYLKQLLLNDYKFEVIQNYQLIANKQQIPVKLLNSTDIFIYQEMGSKWGIYSTCDSVENNILSHLPHNCKQIIIPYVYATWQWSIIILLERDATGNFDKINNETGTNFLYLNKEIICNLKKDYTLDQILQLYDEGTIDFKYKERMDMEISILRQKEQNSHVKVADFILENYKKTKLFTTHNHPTNPIFKHMVNQILELLNVTQSCNELDDSFIIPGEMLYSSYDVKYHNFEFPISIDDNLIKNHIINIYNNFIYK
jgi:hypothetical protein